jgi:hypothetical protein
MGKLNCPNKKKNKCFSLPKGREKYWLARIEYAESISSLSSQYTSKVNRVYRNQLQPFNPADKQG